MDFGSKWRSRRLNEKKRLREREHGCGNMRVRLSLFSGCCQRKEERKGVRERAKKRKRKR
jgi:hypothetical protein